MKTIRIKDYYGIYQEIPVSGERYEEWRALQNETQRIHRKEVYHRDWTPMDDLEEMPQHFTLNELEDALIWDEQVVEALCGDFSVDAHPAAPHPYAHG